MSEYLYVPDDDSEYGPVWPIPEVYKEFPADELWNARPAELVVSLEGWRGHYLSRDFAYEALSILGDDVIDKEDHSYLEAYEDDHEGEVSQYVYEIGWELERKLSDAGYVSVWNDGVQVFKVKQDDEKVTCILHGSPTCNDPLCIGVLKSEVRDAELWGGTE